jgi:hypothetical protein
MDTWQNGKTSYGHAKANAYRDLETYFLHRSREHSHSSIIDRAPTITNFYIVYVDIFGAVESFLHDRSPAQLAELASDSQRATGIWKMPASG